MRFAYQPLCFVVALAAAGTSAAANGVLLGPGTLNSPNDLTRVQDGSNILEFLDLSVTRGLTVNSAVSAYSGNGFHWANGSEVASLFSAFDIGYASAPNTQVTVPSTAVGRAAFVDYLGITDFGTTSQGWLDDLSTTGFHTYSCIGAACAGLSFVNNLSDVWYWPSIGTIGVYLVRVSAVPEPATYASLFGGLACLMLLRQVRGRTNRRG